MRFKYKQDQYVKVHIRPVSRNRHAINQTLDTTGLLPRSVESVMSDINTSFSSNRIMQLTNDISDTAILKDVKELGIG